MKKRTELAFLAPERGKLMGSFTPENAIVLHPYGRFCNANKLAGEVECFRGNGCRSLGYLIDSNRHRGSRFSMAGQRLALAGIISGLWCAARPALVLAETAVFAKSSRAEKSRPPWWEQKALALVRRD